MGISALVGIGIGISGFGALKSVEASKQAAAYQQQEIASEQQAEAVKQQAMEVDAKRKTMEDLRNAQRARSTALTNATSQGASYGSGLQGGYGQVSGASNVAELGINQNLQFGQQLFGINANISQDRIGISQAQSQAAIGAGLSSFGGALVTSAGTLNNIGGSIFGGSGAGRMGIQQITPGINSPVFR